jgi:two-component system chemotaxis response regulator CheY
MVHHRVTAARQESARTRTNCLNSIRLRGFILDLLMPGCPRYANSFMISSSCTGVLLIIVIMLKVVIIDSSAVSRNLLATVLNNGGHEVVGDISMTPANVAKMVKLRPQIVCIDIGEANEDGFAQIEILRTELPKALIFLTSNRIDALTIQSAQERGVHGFIVKPFNSATVLTSIRNAIIKIARQQKQNAAPDAQNG